MENNKNNEPTLLQSLIAEELKKIKVIYCPPGSNSEIVIKVSKEASRQEECFSLAGH